MNKPNDNFNQRILELKGAEGVLARNLGRQVRLNRLLQDDLPCLESLDEKLKRVTDTIVEAFDVDFCRIWVTAPGDRCDSGCVHAKITEGSHVCRQRDRCLQLLASSGRYTHVDGEVHRRVPFGCYKIGRVAAAQDPKFLTNDVQHDPRVHNHEWARDLGLVSFAGYRLCATDGTPIGVLALFAKYPLSPDEDSLLEGVAASTSHVIQTALAEAELRNAHAELEERVRQRTSELARTNEALQVEILERKRVEEELRQHAEMMESANAALQQAYAQLLQAEKMASIGQLAAGVAHEINNPIGFISSNLNSMGHYVEDLLRILKADEELLQECLVAHSSVRANAERAQAVRSEVDVAYLVSDIKALIVESVEGTERVRQIVSDLRDFSHVDNPLLHEEDVNNLLDKTINIAWNELKYKTEVVREYGDAPVITCYGGRLGQAFLNLLVNAVQAIEERGTITVRTGKAEQWAWIEIADTGCGIPTENLNRIFDPFFTTKDVGKGTGMGLHLAYKIVEAHEGRIRAESTVGRGSTFRIELPISGPRAVRETPLSAHALSPNDRKGMGSTTRRPSVKEEAPVQLLSEAPRASARGILAKASESSARH